MTDDLDEFETTLRAFRPPPPPADLFTRIEQGVHSRVHPWRVWLIGTAAMAACVLLAVWISGHSRHDLIPLPEIAIKPRVRSLTARESPAPTPWEYRQAVMGSTTDLDRLLDGRSSVPVSLPGCPADTTIWTLRNLELATADDSSVPERDMH